MKRRNKKGMIAAGCAFVFLGVGIIVVCIFPSEWMIVILALTLIAAGISLMNK